MSILKSEVKIGAVHEIGCRLDDNLETVTKDMHKSDGIVSALSQAVGIVDALNREADKEINEGNMDLEVGSKVRSYLSRASSTLNAQLKAAEQNKNVIAGKVQAFQHAVQVTKKYKDEEMSKLQVLQAALAKGFLRQDDSGETVKSDENSARPDGVHPGLSLKQRRIAEERGPKNDETSPSENINKESKENPTVTEVYKPRSKRGKN